MPTDTCSRKLRGQSELWKEAHTGMEPAFDVSAAYVNAKGSIALALGFLFVLRFTYTAFV